MSKHHARISQRHSSVPGENRHPHRVWKGPKMTVIVDRFGRIEITDEHTDFQIGGRTRITAEEAMTLSRIFAAASRAAG